jgi:mRNA interferase MazF
LNSERQYKRGDVLLIDFEPVRGSEQGRVRPAVVIQNDIANQYSPVLIVAAITASPRAPHLTDIEVSAPEGGLRKDSKVLLNQIRTIDKVRVIERWGTFADETMRKVDEGLKISLGLVPV